MLPQWLRERSFYMAAVTQAELLQEMRNLVDLADRGAEGEYELRKRWERKLAEAGYQPLPGQEGTIKDLRSLRRFNVALRTNLSLLAGWRQKEGGLRPAVLRATPAWELVRNGNRRIPRNWLRRWEAVGGVVINGRMVALKQDLIWAELGNVLNFRDAIGVDYPPFAWGSGMGWRPVGFREAKALGLLDSWTSPTTKPVGSPNESLETMPRVSERELRDELSRALGGLAEWRGDTLVFTDPNGTRSYPAEALVKLWERPLPPAFSDLPGGGQLQREAVRQWAEDHTRFVNDPAAAPDSRPGASDLFDDVWRAFERITPLQSDEPLWRGLSFNRRDGDQPWKGFRAFLDELEANGYTPDPRKPADSWSLAESGARKYASAKRYQVVLVCDTHQSARDISPIVRSLAGEISSPNPAMPIRTDGEAVFLNGTRFRVVKIEVQQDTPEGGRAIVHVEEI